MKKLKATMLMMAIVVVAACTDLDLCTEAAHPHRTQVKFVYNWNEFDNEFDRPDSMYVIANRVINFWKMTAAVCTTKDSPKDGFGRYIYNGLPDISVPVAPSTPGEGNGDDTTTGDDGDTTTGNGDDTTTGDGDTTTTGDGDDTTTGDGGDTTTGDGEITTPDEPGGSVTPQGVRVAGTRAAIGAQPNPAVYNREFYNLLNGEYKFYSFTATDQMDMGQVNKFLLTDDYNMTAEGFNLSYKTYGRTDPAFLEAVAEMMGPLRDKGFSGWNDFNPYSNYMLPSSKPLFIDSVNITKIEGGEDIKVITFTPKPTTQTITLNLKVKKVRTPGMTFTVEGIIGEVSGVPSTINLSNGIIDITTTNKMMFPFEFVNVEEDTGDNNELSCTARINVPSIVPSNNSETNIGPGLMQVFVYCTIYRDGQEPVKRKIQGIINMYNELTNARLIEIMSDGNQARNVGREHTIDIRSEIIIDGTYTLPNEDEEEEGVKGWTQTGIDMDVEL